MGFFSRFGNVADRINAFGLAHPKATAGMFMGTAGLAIGAGVYQSYRRSRNAMQIRQFNKKFHTMWANSHGTIEDQQGRVMAAY